MGKTVVWLLLLIMHLIGGCSSVQHTEQETPEFSSFLDSVQSAEAVSNQAREYREQGEIVKALDLLQASSARFPGNEEISRLIDEYERSWRMHRLALEKQLLLMETRWLIESLPLLEDLAKGHPNNHLIDARILLWQSNLDASVPELVDCGIAFEIENVWMARRCLSMAYRISQTAEIQQRLTAVTNRIEAIEQAARAKLELKEERERVDRVEQLLSEALRARQQGALVDAMEKIDEALKQDPENPRVREQLSELQEQLGREAEKLMQLGDRLYRNQQTAAAIAIWETALKFDPSQAQLTERILRARIVLNKLESIRSSTQPGSP